MLDYGHRGRNPHDVRTSRLAIASLFLSLAGAPPLLNMIVAPRLRSWLLTIGLQSHYVAERVVLSCIMMPTFLSLILATCAAWRIGHNRDQLRGEALAMIVMSLCLVWILNGACFLFCLIPG